MPQPAPPIGENEERGLPTTTSDHGHHSGEAADRPRARDGVSRGGGGVAGGRGAPATATATASERLCRWRNGQRGPHRQAHHAGKGKKKLAQMQPSARARAPEVAVHGLAENPGGPAYLCSSCNLSECIVTLLGRKRGRRPLKSCCCTHKPAACLSRKRGRCCTAAKISGTAWVFLPTRQYIARLCASSHALLAALFHMPGGRFRNYVYSLLLCACVSQSPFGMAIVAAMFPYPR